MADRQLSELMAFLRHGLLHSPVASDWADVAPGVPIVVSTHTHDPAEHSFNERDLPGLFGFRGDSRTEYADDLARVKSEIMVYWIPPPAVQDVLRARAPIFYQVGNTVLKLLQEDVFGDYLDGGSFSEQAEFSVARLSRWRTRTLSIEMTETGPTTQRKYRYLEMTIDTESEERRDTEQYLEPSYLCTGGGMTLEVRPTQ